MTTPSGSGESEDRDEFGDAKAIDAAFDEIVAMSTDDVQIVQQKDYADARDDESWD